jgi:hypothetical protein
MSVAVAELEAVSEPAFATPPVTLAPVSEWWTGLPGNDWRAREHDRDFADRMTALACATRLLAPDMNHISWGLGKADHLARDMLRWLQDDKDRHDAIHGYVRRLVLCLACQQAPAGTELREVVRLADQMYKFAAPPAAGRAA